MYTMRMIVPIAATLLVSLTLPRLVSAEEKPPTPREQEIQQRQAQRQAEQYQQNLDEARQRYEQATQKYESMMHEYEARRAAFEDREPRGPSQQDIEKRIDKLNNHLLDLRRHEVDLRTQMEQLSVSGRPGDAAGVQLEVIEVNRQIEMTQLELEQHQRELERVQERREIGHMQERLEYVANWRDIAFDPQQAVTLATQSLVELHVAQDDAPGAAQALEALLDRVEWTGARTTLRFALKEIYHDMGQPEQAADQLVKIILENSGVKERN